MRLLFSGETIDAHEALALGFLSAVVEPDDLPAAAEDEAKRYLSASPFAVGRMKQLVYGAMANPLDAHLARHGKAFERVFPLGRPRGGCRGVP